MKGRKHRSAGGGVVPRDPSPREVYAGAGSNVVKEADQRKRGGGVHKKKEMGKVHGAKSRMRLDRPGRKMGGRAGADCAPLSSAAKIEKPSGDHEYDSEDDDRGYAKGGHVKEKWVQRAFSHNKGALHRELGVKKDEAIPAKKLAKAANSDNPKLAKRAQLAETAKHFQH